MTLFEQKLKDRTPQVYYTKVCNNSDNWPRANPEGGGVQTPAKSQSYRISFSNIGLDPLKITKLPSQIQCWAIICAPAKRHLRMPGDNGPLIVVNGSSLPSSTKNISKKSRQGWTPSGKTFWIRACWIFGSNVVQQLVGFECVYKRVDNPGLWIIA